MQVVKQRHPSFFGPRANVLSSQPVPSPLLRERAQAGFQVLFVHSMALFRGIGFRQGLVGGETDRLEQEYMDFEHILQAKQKNNSPRIKYGPLCVFACRVVQAGTRSRLAP